MIKLTHADEKKRENLLRFLFENGVYFVISQYKLMPVIEITIVQYRFDIVPIEGRLCLNSYFGTEHVEMDQQRLFDLVETDISPADGDRISLCRARPPSGLRNIGDLLPFLHYLDAIGLPSSLSQERDASIMVTLTNATHKIEVEFFEHEIQYSFFALQQWASHDFAPMMALLEASIAD